MGGWQAGRRLFGAAALIAAGLTWASPGEAQVPPVELTITIDRITEIDHPERGFAEGICWGDYVFEIAIGTELITSPEFSNDPGFGEACIGAPGDGPVTFDIGFTASAMVDADAFTVPVSVVAIDVDIFDDDTMDLSPVVNNRAAKLNVDPLTGLYTLGAPRGTTPFINPRVAEGNGDGNLRARIDFTVSMPTQPDTDEDGIPDVREAQGFDWDRSGTVGDGPGEQPDPNVPDIFLELDVANSPAAPGNVLRADVQAMKEAFRRAGFTLWVDTGDLVDPNATEGAVLGTCEDGIDNGADGTTDNGIDANGDGVLEVAQDPDCIGGAAYLDASTEDGTATCADGNDNDGSGQTDSADPTCLVGDDMGGGGRLLVPGGTNQAAVNVCGTSRNFYLLKNADPNGDGVPEDISGNDGVPDNTFAVDRRRWFRYGLSAPATDFQPMVDSDMDGNPTNDCPLAQAEYGGNDLIDHTGLGGPIMHELGHTLALHHGGIDKINCKPNYVSVMSYDHTAGIQRVNGGRLLDFSRPRIVPDGSRRGRVPPNISEGALDETLVLDPGDNTNLGVLRRGGATTRTPFRLDQNVDYSGDGPGGDPPWETGAMVDINTKLPGAAGPGCPTVLQQEFLIGFDDWSYISVPFRQFGDVADFAVNEVDEELRSAEDAADDLDSLNSTDLAVSAADSPDPVAAGGELTYTVEVANQGPAIAVMPRLDVELSPGLVVAEAPGACVADDADVRCGLSSLDPGGSASIVIEVDTSGVPFSPGAATSLRTSFSVANGDYPDGDGSDNTAVVDTRVNRPPIADAGNDSVVQLAGTTVALDGTGSSDPDGDPLGHAWTLVSAPAGSAPALDDPTSPTPSFVPDAVGEYVFELVVSDGSSSSAPDRVSVTVVGALVLVDADTDTDLLFVTDGAVIDLSALDATRFNLRADFLVAGASVRFTWNDRPAQVDNTPPYALGGDTSSGDYAPTPWLTRPGTHHLTATLYSLTGAQGLPLSQLAATFVT